MLVHRTHVIFTSASFSPKKHRHTRHIYSYKYYLHVYKHKNKRNAQYFFFFLSSIDRKRCAINNIDKQKQNYFICYSIRDNNKIVSYIEAVCQHKLLVMKGWGRGRDDKSRKEIKTNFINDDCTHTQTSLVH